jgi:hypothetical protein
MMKTNSLINSLYNRMTKGAPKPAVGMGCTMTGWTDRYPGTVVKVTEFGGSKRWAYEIEVMADNYRVVKGWAHDGSAEYAYSPDPTGCPYLFAFDRKAEKWVEAFRNPATGKLNTRKGKGLILGFRERYCDPSF